MTAVHVVVPDGIDDPARPSGGNAYDRRVCARARGRAAGRCACTPCRARGRGPMRRRAPPSPPSSGRSPTAPSCCSTGWSRRRPRRCSCRRRAGCGWSRSCTCRWATTPATTAPGRGRRAVLSAAAAVVTTSAWTRRTLLELYSLPGDRVHVAEPGVDAADLAPGTPTAGALLCVAAVIPGKGHDVLLDALATIAGLLVALPVRGQPGARPGLRGRPAPPRPGRRAGATACASRARGPEPISSAATPTADLLVLASRAETYGMVVTEALARGLPVVAAEVGGVPEALGHGADGDRPGPARPARRPCRRSAPRCSAWLGDAELRRRLRRAARERRASLAGWSATTVGPRRRPGRPRRDDRRGHPGQLRSGSTSARRPTPRLAPATSSSTSRPRLPATGPGSIHDLACGTGSMGRWLAPLLPGPQRWVRARPRRGAAAGRRRRPSRPGRRRRLRRRRDEAVRHHPAARGRPRRRRPRSPPRRCST